MHPGSPLAVRLVASVSVGAALVGALVLALFLTSALPAHAATWCVHPTGGGDCFTTIQDAVTAAASGDTINIAAGTYAEHVVVGSKVLTFIGAGADSTMIDGGKAGRVFNVEASSVSFADLTIRNGKITGDSGGGIYAAGALTLTNVNVLSNTVDAGSATTLGGGGVRVRGMLWVTGGRFENNLATGSTLVEGGAIFSNASASPHPDVTISGATFTSNTARYGGAVSLAANVWLTDTQFISNTATSRGGGVFSSAGATMTLSGGRFEHNSVGATGRGGGVYFTGAAVMSGTDFISNTSRGTGGGARIVGVVTLTDTLFTGNSATSGGGGLYAGSTVNVTNGQFKENSTSSSGGGLYCASTATVSGTAFISNTSSTGGGLYAGSTVDVTYGQFTGNAAGSGGGLAMAGSPAGNSRVVNSVFGANSATSNGAALHFSGAASGGTATILHTTIGSPSLGASQAIYIGGTYGVTTDIKNTIVAGYTVGIQRVAGTVTAWNTLFHGNTTDIDGTVTNNDPVTGDPLFVDPANDDYHLGADSPAVDAGIDASVTTDYDGDTRPQGMGYDIGYDEVLQQCDLNTTDPAIFASPAITLTFSDLGDVDCAAAVYFPRSHAQATGSIGHGVGGDHFWQVVARTAGGAAATGFTATLTAPTGGFSDPNLCFYSGMGVNGWDCAGAVDGDNISRVITHFSDWAVGNEVGPTAVTLGALAAKRPAGVIAPLGLALIAFSIAAMLRARRQRQRNAPSSSSCVD